MAKTQAETGHMSRTPGSPSVMHALPAAVPLTGTPADNGAITAAAQSTPEQLANAANLQAAIAKKVASFKKLAGDRMPKVLQRIRQIGNLSVLSNYSYTKSQAERIVNTLQAAVDDVKRQFAGTTDNKPEWDVGE